MRRNGWDALIILLVLGALAGVFYMALFAYRNDTCSVTGVLGTIVPAIAAIGAAAYGVTAGQQAGAAQAAAADSRAAQATERYDTLRRAVSGLPEVLARVDGQVTRLPRAVQPTGDGATVATDDLRVDLAQARATLEAVLA